jgi:hypothetical protein
MDKEVWERMTYFDNQWNDEEQDFYEYDSEPEDTVNLQRYDNVADDLDAGDIPEAEQNDK